MSFLTGSNLWLEFVMSWFFRSDPEAKREAGAFERSGKAGAAPATVSGEPRSKLSLGNPGKTDRGFDPRARRPAMAN